MALLYLKAFHVIFMVSWFAGLFYLPRLFVYHAMAMDDPIGCARFQIMERKLFWGIMTPAALLTVAFGLWMAVGYADYGRWLAYKGFLVAFLLGYHVWCGFLVRAFARNVNRHSHVWYRWFNEFPVLILIPVAILAIVKPA